MPIVRHGQKIVRLDSLKLPGDIRERQKKPHVIALAESFAATGGLPMHAPTVDKETHRIVAGRDRTAAMMLAGIKEAPVEQVSGDPIDLARATIIENFHRRPDDRQVLAKQLTDLEQAEFEGKDPEPEPILEEPKQRTKQLGIGSIPNCAAQEKAKGRPVATGRKQAIAKVAKELNIKETTVKSLVQRAEAKEKKKTDPVVPVEPPIKTLGIEIPPEVLHRINTEQAYVDDLSNMFTRISTELTWLEEITPEYGQQRTDAREHLRALAHDIRSSRPWCVCPYCKLIPKYRKTCLACKGRGHLPKNRTTNIPKELFLEGDEAGIFVDGKWVSLISLEGC